MLGADGVTDATRYAILNANYIKARLEQHYPVLYARANGRVAHELIFDLRGIQGGRHRGDGRREAADGLRLPRADRVVSRRRHADGGADRERGQGGARSILRRDDSDSPRDRGGRARARPIATDNVLKNAPHTAAAIAAADWPHPYSREEAAFPLPFVRANKFWPSVGRIDNPYGDRESLLLLPASRGICLIFALPWIGNRNQVIGRSVLNAASRHGR